VLQGRTIVLGVTGGISAYKAIEVCRRLVDAGAHVAPVMPEGAERFVGRTTLSALASEPVQTTLFDERDPIPHTRLGQRADLVLVCPATARLLGSYAAGISDDLLTATLLATRAPVVACTWCRRRRAGWPAGTSAPAAWPTPPSWWPPSSGSSADRVTWRAGGC
jgi:phosphopantothenoylcysteine decarboxylase/phosphopantothenate--cysteine ligase